MRHRLPVGVISAAEGRARNIGVGADRVLVAGGLISEEAYVRAFAHSAGLPFEPLDDMSRAACPLDDKRLIEAAAAGLLPLRTERGLVMVVAPRHMAARRLYELVGGSEELSKCLHLTSASRLRDFVARHAGVTIGRIAADELRLARPRFSAASIRPRSALAILAAVLALSFGLFIAPEPLGTAIGVTLALLFLAWTGLRLMSAFRRSARVDDFLRLPPDRLPVYTIIVALYREARAVPGLIAALDALDYPPEKLDIKLVLEADDAETGEAIAALSLGPPYEVIIAPDCGPRTKPKALNAALPFARGGLTVVYDAEDRPEPDQLQCAVAAFRAGLPNLACVQARLAIDNTEDSWLSRLFTAEYAGHFDVFLPGLAARHLPLPLGGSSNHFDTAVLRKVGAWDPHNVTEDADLGMRLARHGYVSDVIASTTYEEAPARLDAWLKQRTRWFKGWLQTWLVHMRAPGVLWRDLGAGGFWTFQLVVGGTVLAALIHPLFVVGAVYGLFVGQFSRADDDAVDAVLAALYGCTFLAGYFASATLAAIGLARRGLLARIWVLALLPLHWALLSLAAWRALYKLVVDPYRWEKTEHGLAHTSRLMRRKFGVSAD